MGSGWDTRQCKCHGCAQRDYCEVLESVKDWKKRCVVEARRVLRLGKKVNRVLAEHEEAKLLLRSLLVYKSDEMKARAATWLSSRSTPLREKKARKSR